MKIFGNTIDDCLWILVCNCRIKEWICCKKTAFVGKSRDGFRKLLYLVFEIQKWYVWVYENFLKQKYPIYLQFRKKIDIKTSTKEFFGYIDAKMSIYTQEDINWWVLLEQNVSIYPKCKMIVQDTSSVSTFCKKILSYRCKNIHICNSSARAIGKIVLRTYWQLRCHFCS